MPQMTQIKWLRMKDVKPVKTARPTKHAARSRFSLAPQRSAEQIPGAAV
eukprot:gene6659-354_t